MSINSIWKKEVKITYRFMIVLLVSIFVLSGISAGVFLNYLFPRLPWVPGISLISPRSSVVVNRTEQIFINDTVDTREIYNRLKAVTVTLLSFADGAVLPQSDFMSPAVGTGIIVTSDGLIFSSKTALGAPKNKLKAILNDGRIFDAEVAASDPRSDLVILKIPAENLSVSPFVAADKLMVGQKLVSVGGNSDTSNLPGSVVSAVSLPSAFSAFPQYLFSDQASEWLDVNPPLVTHYDGAGLADSEGRVAGLVAGKLILGGGYLQASLDIYLKQQNLTRGALGLHYVITTPSLARIMNLPDRYGIFVLSKPGTPAVTLGGAANVAGLREGDFIYKINAIALDSEQSLEKIISRKIPGEIMEITFSRAGQERTVQAVLKPLK